MADASTITANGITYNIKDAVARAAQQDKILTLTVASFSSFPKTITNSKITTDMVVLNVTWGNPSAILSDVTWSTNMAGQLTLNGTISGSTTATITLGRSSF